jgi:hypothetical protein
VDGGLIWANHLPWIFSDVGQKSQIRSEKNKRSRSGGYGVHDFSIRVIDGSWTHMDSVMSHDGLSFRFFCFPVFASCFGFLFLSFFLSQRIHGAGIFTYIDP